jgi:hypothetical protein
LAVGVGKGLGASEGLFEPCVVDMSAELLFDARLDE